MPLSLTLFFSPPAFAALLAFAACIGACMWAARRPGNGGPASPAAYHAATRDLSPDVEAALWRGTLTTGMTPNQVSLARGVPRKTEQVDPYRLWVYDAPQMDGPGHTFVFFVDGQVASVRRAPVTGRSTIPHSSWYRKPDRTSDRPARAPEASSGSRVGLDAEAGHVLPSERSDDGHTRTIGP